MKIYNVTFDMGYGDDKRTFSLPAVADTAKAAEENTKSLLFLLTAGTVPDNVKANAVVFGADGSGKSLNKLKKKK